MALGWIRYLQNRVSSLYSNITFVKTNDEKRVEELINLIKAGLKLNMTLPTAEIESIYFVDGANNFKVMQKSTGWKTQEIEVDEFSPNPLAIYFQSKPKNSILILYRFLSLSEGIQNLLLSKARDTTFMNSNHILVFVENTGDINPILLSYSNIVDVPLSLNEERERLIKDFIAQVKNIAKDIEVINDINAVVRATSGLNLMQFESLLYEGFIEFVMNQKTGIPPSWFAKKKIEMINMDETFTLTHPTHGIDAFASPKIIKDYIYNRIIKVIKEYEKARKIGLKYPDGLLLFGMQGTGKTWLARAIAKEINVPFMEFNVSSVMSKFYGETEKKVEKMIKILDSIQPAVLFIDEIDAIALRRSEFNGDSGVSRRMINRLMSWLSEDKQVLVIGSTNRPEQMDEAFIRSGRFSFKIPILLPDLDTRKDIFKIHLNLRNSPHKDIDFNELSKKSKYFTGADIVKVVDDAIYFAFSNNKDVIDMECFDEAFKEIVVNRDRNKELQKEYLKYAERFGTIKSIIDAYKYIDAEITNTDRIELLKNVIKGE